MSGRKKQTARKTVNQPRLNPTRTSRQKTTARMTTGNVAPRKEMTTRRNPSPEMIIAEKIVRRNRQRTFKSRTNSSRNLSTPPDHRETMQVYLIRKGDIPNTKGIDTNWDSDDETSYGRNFESDSDSATDSDNEDSDNDDDDAPTGGAAGSSTGSALVAAN